MSLRTNNLIINSFDRSGSNAIIKTLAQHPQIEYLMNPFNGGSIRKKTNFILTSNNTTQEDFSFFKNLENETLYTDYIKSGWFNTHSTTTKFIKGHLHILKTTLNHFTVEWLNHNFPKIETWGIWRNPYDILASIIRNNFHKDWYIGFKDEIISTVLKNNQLKEEYGTFIHQIDSDVRTTAFLLSVKNYYFFKNINHYKIFSYENFIENPNKAVEYFMRYFRLDDFVFKVNNSDLNIVGKEYMPGRGYKNVIPTKDKDFIKEVLKPLKKLITEKYNNKLSFERN